MKSLWTRLVFIPRSKAVSLGYHEQDWAWAQIKDWCKPSDEWKHVELSELKTEIKMGQWK